MLEDWQNAELVQTMRHLHPGLSAGIPNYPNGHEHRKAWEYAQTLRGLRRLGVLPPDGLVLSVAGGHEEPAFELTNHVRWVFLTDRYGTSNFREFEGDSSMLVAPDRFAPFPYNRKRLVVQHMDALDLRFEDNTFDALLCLSSVEHFGGFSEAIVALREMHRVLKPNGVAALTTECIVNGGPEFQDANMILFTPQSLLSFSQGVPGMDLVEPFDSSMSEMTLQTRQSLVTAVVEGHQGRVQYPHIILEIESRQFTSGSLFFRKTV
jgi:SAM-dependent methyltransferase